MNLTRIDGFSQIQGMGTDFSRASIGMRAEEIQGVAATVIRTLAKNIGSDERIKLQPSERVPLRQFIQKLGDVDRVLHDDTLHTQVAALNTLYRVHTRETRRTIERRIIDGFKGLRNDETLLHKIAAIRGDLKLLEDIEIDGEYLKPLYEILSLLEDPVSFPSMQVSQREEMIVRILFDDSAVGRYSHVEDAEIERRRKDVFDQLMPYTGSWDELLEGVSLRRCREGAMTRRFEQIRDVAGPSLTPLYFIAFVGLVERLASRADKRMLPFFREKIEAYDHRAGDIEGGSGGGGAEGGASAAAAPRMQFSQAMGHYETSMGFHYLRPILVTQILEDSLSRLKDRLGIPAGGGAAAAQEAAPSAIPDVDEVAQFLDEMLDHNMAAQLPTVYDICLKPRHDWLFENLAHLVVPFSQDNHPEEILGGEGVCYANSLRRVALLLKDPRQEAGLMEIPAGTQVAQAAQRVAHQQMLSRTDAATRIDDLLTREIPAKFSLALTEKQDYPLTTHEGGGGGGGGAAAAVEEPSPYPRLVDAMETFANRDHPNFVIKLVEKSNASAHAINVQINPREGQFCFYDDNKGFFRYDTVAELKEALASYFKIFYPDHDRYTFLAFRGT